MDSAGKSQPAPASANSPIKVSIEAADASLEGERKTVTALFADIKGSTELEQNLDPEEARAINRSCTDIADLKDAKALLDELA